KKKKENSGIFNKESNSEIIQYSICDFSMKNYSNFCILILLIFISIFNGQIFLSYAEEIRFISDYYFTWDKDLTIECDELQRGKNYTLQIGANLKEEDQIWVHFHAEGQNKFITINLPEPEYSENINEIELVLYLNDQSKLIGRRRETMEFSPIEKIPFFGIEGDNHVFQLIYGIFTMCLITITKKRR
ncbi:MAG: hypothetical protein ACFFCQ_05525, partial [Promethearchaeota archaeon]